MNQAPIDPAESERNNSQIVSQLRDEIKQTAESATISTLRADLARVTAERDGWRKQCGVEAHLLGTTLAERDRATAACAAMRAAMKACHDELRDLGSYNCPVCMVSVKDGDESLHEDGCALVLALSTDVGAAFASKYDEMKSIISDYASVRNTWGEFTGRASAIGIMFDDKAIARPFKTDLQNQIKEMVAQLEKFSELAIQWRQSASSIGNNNTWKPLGNLMNNQDDVYYECAEDVERILKSST